MNGKLRRAQNINTHIGKNKTFISNLVVIHRISKKSNDKNVYYTL